MPRRLRKEVTVARGGGAARGILRSMRLLERHPILSVAKDRDFTKRDTRR